MDYWTAFVIGFVGSFHCAGMCGPLALAVPNPTRSRTGFLLGRVAYNLGRIITYCVLGLVVGLIGKSLALAGFQRWVSIALGIGLLTGLFFSRKLRLTFAVSSLVQRLKTAMGPLLRQNTVRAPHAFYTLFTLGLLNGLLPCGLVYAAAAGAAAMGNIVSGLGYMAAFGAGTLPIMLAISLGAKAIPFKWRFKLQRAIPVSVFLLAMLLILRGMSLGVPYLSPDLAHSSCCCK